jgi:hypothetical protein
MARLVVRCECPPPISLKLPNLNRSFFHPSISRRRKGKRKGSLQERLDEFKNSFESGAPPYNAPHEAIETMHRATAELKATGIEERALKVSDRAPSFTLFNQDHVQMASADLLRQGLLVVSFFRGHW